MGNEGAHPSSAREGLPGAMLARFAELRGRRVFEGLGVPWVQDRGAIYTSVPYQGRVGAAPEEIASMLRRERVAGARYPTLNGGGLPNGLYWCNPAGYGLERVDRKYRGQVKKGLEAFEIRRMDPDELSRLGFELNLQTMERQGRFDPEFGDERGWNRLVAAVRGCPGMAATGAFLDGRLSSYIISCRDGAWLHLMYKMTRSEDLTRHSTYALDYWLLREASKDPGIAGVSNGLVGVVAASNSDGLRRYKTNLGYGVLELEIAVQFHPAFQNLATSALTVGMVKLASRFRPQSRGLAVLARVLDAARAPRANPRAVGGSA